MSAFEMNDMNNLIPKCLVLVQNRLVFAVKIVEFGIASATNSINSKSPNYSYDNLT